MYMVRTELDKLDRKPTGGEVAFEELLRDWLRPFPEIRRELNTLRAQNPELFTAELRSYRSTIENGTTFPYQFLLEFRRKLKTSDQEKTGTNLQKNTLRQILDQAAIARQRQQRLFG